MRVAKRWQTARKLEVLFPALLSETRRAAPGTEYGSADQKSNFNPN